MPCGVRPQVVGPVPHHVEPKPTFTITIRQPPPARPASVPASPRQSRRNSGNSATQPLLLDHNKAQPKEAKSSCHCLDKCDCFWGNDVSLALQLFTLIITNFIRGMASGQKPYDYTDLLVKVPGYVQLVLNVILWCLSWRGSSHAVASCASNFSNFLSFLALLALFGMDFYWAVKSATTSWNYVAQAFLDATGFWAMLNFVNHTNWSGVHVAWTKINSVLFCLFCVEIAAFEALSLPQPRFYNNSALSLSRMICEQGVLRVT